MNTGPLKKAILERAFRRRNPSEILILSTLQTARVLGAFRVPAARPSLQAVEARDYDESPERNVYGLLGLPIDAIDFRNLMVEMDAAVAKREPLLISTPNVNFLIKSYDNADFRDSVLGSNLCLVDGMPLIWIAKLLRLPIEERVAGSDLFSRLKARTDARLRVFLFGGTGELAAKVGEKLNTENCGLECVGVLNPGFSSVEELSSAEIINQIKLSGAIYWRSFLMLRRRRFGCGAIIII